MEVASARLRAGGAADAVDGVVPRQVAEPASGPELAGVLAWASHERLATVVRGGGTKLQWGRVPSSVDLVVSTARLNRHLSHRHGDLTVTVASGMTLADLNRELLRNGQRLPVDSAFEAATIGGILATNDAGPRRHRHGTARDALIGITLALADGRIVKAGGNVVKNVAGYDLGKLVCGSFGSLAAIVDATFKLMPVTPASGTLVASYATDAALVRDVAAIAASQLEPEACDVRIDSGTSPQSGAAPALLLRFASTPAATAAQLEAARALMSGEITAVDGEAEAALWTRQTRASWLTSGAVIRFSWLPAKLPDVLALVREAQRMAPGGVTFTGRAMVGAGTLAVEADVPVQAGLVERLRSTGAVGHVVVLRGPRALKEAIDVWGAPGSSIAVARAVKQMLDPGGILNAGRGPV